MVPKGGLSRWILVLSGSTALSQGLLILASPVLTRIYTAKDFGVLTLYTSVISVLVVIASLRFEMALPLPADHKRAANLLALSFLALFATTVITALVIALWGERIIALDETIRPYLFLLPISMFGAGGYQILNSWATRLRAFDQVSKTRVTQSIGQILTQLGFGVLFQGPTGLIMGDVVSRISGTGTLARLTKVRGILSLIDRETLREVAKRYARFPLVTSWASLCTVVSVQMTPVLLAQYFGSETVGHFGLGYRMLGMPALVLGQAVGQTLMARSAQVREDAEQLRSMAEQVTLMLLAAGLPIFGVIAVAGQRLFPLIFGPEWVTSGVYAQILAPWFFLWLISSPLSALGIVREWQVSTFFFTVFELFLRFGSLTLGGRTGSDRLTLSLLSASGVIISALAIAWFLRAAYSGIQRVAKRGLILMGFGAVGILPSWWASVHSGSAVLITAAVISVLGFYFFTLKFSKSLLGLDIASGLRRHRSST